ncbi:MAG: FAD-dependent oxidoreductase, partial [Bacteroidota bacterium]|nr:FAD-dependent oxidoreductase [Bacteroidota bacterium]
MAHYTYVIIGAGMTGDSAVKGIRSMDTEGTIALIGSEKDKPYDRPPLSKKLWKGDAIDTIWRKTPEEGLTYFLGSTVQSIDPKSKSVKLDGKDEITFD